MRYFPIHTFILLLIVTSCASGVDLKPIPLGPLLYDSNSKVWMVDKVIVDNKNFAPSKNLDKDVLIFYRSGKCMFQPMRTLGDMVGRKGDFTVYSEEKTLTIYFQRGKWDFTISAITEDTIVLNPTKASDVNYTMVLVPFPEF